MQNNPQLANDGSAELGRNSKKACVGPVVGQDVVTEKETGSSPQVPDRLVVTKVTDQEFLTKRSERIHFVQLGCAMKIFVMAPCCSTTTTSGPAVDGFSP